MSFDWQTDDKTVWEEAPKAPPLGKPPKRRRWLWVAVGLLLLLLTTAVLARALQQRLETVTGQVETEVLASDTVLQEAALRGDGEMFASFLSGRDEAWAADTTQLAADRAIYQRTGMGLTWLPEAAAAPPLVTLSPDLRAAEVAHDVAYAIQVGNGLTETVVLRQTAVYRTGPNRWLLSPPEADFWGESRTIAGQYLSIQYSARDAVLVERLLLQIDGKLGEMCTQLPNFSCPPDFQMAVSFSTEPGSLMQADLPAVLADDSARLPLPAPTLAGIPQSESAYQALFRGYASLILAAAITDIVDWRCCEQAVFYKAVLNELLRELGLRPVAVTSEQFDTLWRDGVAWDAGAAVWQANGRTESILPTAILGLAQDVWGHTAVSLAYSLAENPRRSYWDWLRSLAGRDFSANEDLQRAWRGYVYGRSTAGQAAQPIPFPNQDLQLLCRPNLEQRLAFYRYNLATGAFTLEQPLNRDVAYMVALPEDDGLAVWERIDNPGMDSLFLWHEGRKIELSWEKTSSSAGSLPYQVDPTGAQLILVPDNIVDATYGLLDVAGCLAGDCQVTAVPGYPVVSPDGEWAIALESAFPITYAQTHGILKLVDDQGEVVTAVGEGTSPFWVDERTFAYVLDAGEGRRDTLMRGSPDSPAPQKWLDVGEITAILSDTGQLRLIDFAAMTPDPHVLALITVSAQGDGNIVELLAYDFVDEKLVAHQRLHESGLTVRDYQLSPDGRWLLLRLIDDGAPALIWLDLSTFTFQQKALQPDPYGQASLAWSADWSAEGNWLALRDGDLVRLLAPAYNYETLFIPAEASCTTAVWVNPAHE